MKKYHPIFALFISLCLSVSAQIRLPGYNQNEIDSRLYGRWRASWISLRGEPANVYGVYHFRKSFELEEIPRKFIVHVSADHRYKLYVNGQFVSLGPARCDTYNWNFETVDIAPYLKTGKNVLASVVWNFGKHAPAAQMTFNQTGFILQGNTEKEDIVNTNKSWKCIRNQAYTVWNGPRVVSTFFSGPGELVKDEAYPWGWEQTDYDDTAWNGVALALPGSMKDSRNYRGRMLVPRPIPPMEMTPTRLSSVRIAEGVSVAKNFLKQPVKLTIPANKSVRLVLDNQVLTTGYPTLLYSKGKGSEVKIGYTEAFYLPESSPKKERLPKGNRNEVEGKVFYGCEDIVLPDGGEKRSFTPLWWRTWRYIELQIQTKEEPLVIDDIHATFSAYPFKAAFAFDAPDRPELARMLEIGWRTARLCVNETYMDCPYYEQLQYWGDTRIQAMVTNYNTRDSLMVRNAIEQGRQSIVADGITKSRYPSERRQFISSFSLAWIGIGYDYWWYRGDEEYLKTLLPAYRGVLAWYEQWLKPDYSLKRIPHWFFADWVPSFPSGGEPIREKEGNSAYQDLVYILALEEVAQMEEAFGIPAMSNHYREVAAKVRKNFHSKYWNEARRMFADTYSHGSYSQHVNSLAILAGMVKGEEAKALMHRILNDAKIAKATIYFRYYVNRALVKAGLGDEYLDNLGSWYDQMKLGLTTWAETPDPARSDCHAWGASPNIELFRVVLGIDSDAPGFGKVRISPSLGTLKEVSGTMPHPKGSISAAYKLNKQGHLTATIVLPTGVDGQFVWKGKEYPLQAGKHRFDEISMNVSVLP